MPKLTRSDATLALLGVLGVVVIFLLYESAFPTALVRLDVTREEAVEAAQEFIEGMGADLDDFRRAALFAGDSEALVFLQQSLGDEETSRWATDIVPVWRWDIRWFQPEQTEEWLAEVGVDGRVVAFRHVISESAPGADLSEDEARAIAETFLVGRGVDPRSLEPVSASEDRKDNRTDHLFVWRVTGTEIPWSEGDAAGSGYARLSVRVHGDRVGGFVRSLRVPEEFTRALQRTLSVGQFLALGSIGLMIVMAVAAAVLAIQRFRVGDVNWRPALMCGGLVTVAFYIAMATSWPQFAFSYTTQVPWYAFIGVGAIALLVLSLLTYFAPVTFATAAGESLAREFYPQSVRGFVDAMRGRLFTAEFGAASLRGYALAAAFMGYLTAFYWFARSYMGAWLPAEGPYSSIFNNVLPFLTPLTISLVAAISEETIYRLFGVTLGRKLFRSTTAALIVPAAIWAFGHSNYPVFPVYVRGIELTILGTLFGVAFLRYGLVACIVAHYVIDAVALGVPLVTSGNASYAVSGLVVIALALVPGLVGLVAGRRAPAPDEPGAARPATTTNG